MPPYHIPEFNNALLAIDFDNVNAAKEALEKIFSDKTLVANCQALDELLSNPLHGFLKDFEDKVRFEEKSYILPYLAWLAVTNKAESLNDNLIETLAFTDHHYDFSQPFKNHLLAIAIACGSREFIKKAIELTLFDDHDIEEGILYAIEENNVDMVRYISKLAHKAHRTGIIRCNPEDYPLFVALQHEAIDKIDYLLNHGFNVNARTTENVSLLHQAILMQVDINIVKILLKHDADTRYKWDNLTATDFAHKSLYRNNAYSKEVVSLLIKKDPTSLNFKTNLATHLNGMVFIGDLPPEKVVVALVNNANPLANLTEEEAKEWIRNRDFVFGHIKDVYIETSFDGSLGLNYDESNNTYYDHEIKTARECIQQLRYDLTPNTAESKQFEKEVEGLLSRYLKSNEISVDFSIALYLNNTCKIIPSQPRDRNWSAVFEKLYYHFEIDTKKFHDFYLIKNTSLLHSKLQDHFKLERQTEGLVSEAIENPTCRLHLRNNVCDVKFSLQEITPNDIENYAEKLKRMGLDVLIKISANKPGFFTKATITILESAQDICAKLEKLSSQKRNEMT